MAMKRFLAVLSLLLISGIYSTAQENAIAPPENIVTDGVPKIPASLAGAIERYTENRAAFQSDWHPKRREMIIGTRFGNTFQAHLVKMPGGARQPSGRRSDLARRTATTRSTV